MPGWAGEQTPTPFLWLSKTKHEFRKAESGVAVGMENIMRIKSLLLILSTLLTSANLFASDAFETGGLWYKECYSHRAYTSLYVVPSESGDKYKGDVIIPKSVNHDGKDYLVVGIGDNAFKDCTELTSVTFEGIIEWIGNNAFENCTGLTEFTIPPFFSDTMYEGTIYLGYRAFWGCHLNSITCMIATPPYYDYTKDPSHKSSFYSMPSNPDWIGWDWSDHWHETHATTLYVPVGTINDYKKKEYGGRNSWGYYFSIIKEWGVEESDSVPGLYDRIDELTNIYKEKELYVRDNSQMAYYVLLDTLYVIAEQEGRDITSLQQQLDSAFEKEVAYGWREGDGYGEFEYKLIPSLKKAMEALWSFIADAADKLEQMQEKRIAYYTARRAGDNKTADELKSEIDNAVSEIDTLLKKAALELHAFTTEYIQEETDKFLTNLEANITAVPTVKVDAGLANSPWYNVKGQRLPGNPSAKGLYIRNGRKVIVK